MAVWAWIRRHIAGVLAALGGVLAAGWLAIRRREARARARALVAEARAKIDAMDARRNELGKRDADVREELEEIEREKVAVRERVEEAARTADMTDEEVKRAFDSMLRR
jgi:chromosome segregation ATPase